MNRFFVALSLFLLGFQVQGWAANFGDGVKLTKQAYLIDLIEAGAEKAPHFSTKVKAAPEILSRMDKVFKHLSGFPTRELSQKLTELRAAHPYLTEIVLQSIENLSWRIIVATPDLDDDGVSLVDYAGTLVSLAVKEGNFILIRRPLWEMMPVGHRVALVIHEALTANFLISRDDRKDIRSLVGFLFTGELESRGFEGLSAAVSGLETLEALGHWRFENALIYPSKSVSEGRFSSPATTAFWSLIEDSELKLYVDYSKVGTLQYDSGDRLGHLVQDPAKIEEKCKDLLLYAERRESVAISATFQSLTWHSKRYSTDKCYGDCRLESTGHSEISRSFRLSELGATKEECAVKIAEALVEFEKEINQKLTASNPRK